MGFTQLSLLYILKINGRTTSPTFFPYFISLYIFVKFRGQTQGKEPGGKDGITNIEY